MPAPPGDIGAHQIARCLELWVPFPGVVTQPFGGGLWCTKTRALQLAQMWEQETRMA